MASLTTGKAVEEVGEERAHAGDSKAQEEVEVGAVWAKRTLKAARVRDWEPEDKANTQWRARISTRTRECRQQQANAGYSIIW
jgi:hypothetical protein